MKVYVLKWVTFDHFRFVEVFGVYSTPEKARDAARKFESDMFYSNLRPILQYSGDNVVDGLGKDVEHYTYIR